MKRLYRSEDNRILAGVLGGVGEYFSIDPVIIRIIAVVVALVTGVIPFALIYLLAVFMVPKQSEAIIETDSSEYN